MQVCSWNDMENEAGKGEPETDESETLMTFPKEKMKNIHLIGGEISLDQNGIEATPGLTAIVSDVTISVISAVCQKICWRMIQKQHLTQTVIYCQ